MGKYTLLILLLVSMVHAQIPPIDVTFREKLSSQKTKHYQQMRICEQQKTANQDHYNVTYYALDLTPNPTTATLYGTVEIVAKVVAPTLNQVELNCWAGLSITRIYDTNFPDVPLKSALNNDLLTIYLNQTYRQGGEIRITVAYSGRPQNSPYQAFSFDTYNNAPMIWTLSSVYGARSWWPCKDVPSDKPDSVDIKVTVPANLIVVSNGALRETMNAGNQKIFHWHEKYPIATYLVFLAIYPYEVHYDHYLYNNQTDTMTLHFYNFPGNYEANLRLNRLVKEMLACYAKLFGEYPFADEKYGQADFLWGGGMEHQTCTCYGSWNEALYAHEIAHQWWGNLITCHSFHHIWLNEGFASYCEALWFESTYPPFTASQYQMMYQLYLGPGTVYVEHPEYEDIFDSGLSYVKGSWILHMLRHIVGDTAFFQILKTYYNAPAHKYGTATTEEFQAICEQVSGINLDKFFYQWLYEEYFPQYSYSWHWTRQGTDYVIDLEIRQEQTNYTFWSPIDITVTSAAGEKTFIVWDSLATQSFQLTVASEPTKLELDKNDWVLKRRPEKLVNPTFDRGILLVNGVLFDSYGTEIRNSYQNRAFCGDFPISFWDCFDVPAGGYPATLPTPLGHGKVPADVLGQFSTVIWIGNNYSGDLGSWQLTSILAYLEAGGNLLLLTRDGQNFIDDKLRAYLGITWAENPLSTINNCVATFPGLTNMAFTGNQSNNAVFETTLNNDESTLLFTETNAFKVPRGLGVWRHPTAGGKYRSDGGQFVYLSGRPYRYEATQLRANVEYILTNLLHESGSTNDGLPIEFTLEQNYPNPFNNFTTIRYALSQPAQVTLKIYNARGELIRSLLDKKATLAGLQQVVWDGKDARGSKLSSAIYFYQLQINASRETKKLLLLK